MRRTYGAKRRLVNKKEEKIALLEYDNYMLNEERKILEDFQWDAIKVLTYFYHNRPEEAQKYIRELMDKHECYIITIPPK
ncbi:hypothetical protein JANET_223 [Bacillus phage Janet]|nr:hypothetical protein JANET_223 [Bacillus phage Janet]